MHGNGFSHSGFASSGGAFRHPSGMSGMHHSASGSPTGSHRTHMTGGAHHMHVASGHHTHVASNGTPSGFSHGKASWKQNGGTPPGWSHGKKTGWGCTPGSAGCKPPGLAKKASGTTASGTTSASHTRVASSGPPTGSTSRASHARSTPVSFGTRPALHKHAQPSGVLP
jgi:hypothetical protein